MSNKHFVIAIGGTGMRCLESFVHLCAIGMFDGLEFDILTLDTDQNNWNKARVEDLIVNYNNVKQDDKVDVQPNKNTFFSAKLNLYKFYTNYGDQNRNTYDLLSVPVPGLPNSDKIKQDNKDLSDLFLDKNVQSFDLGDGYRAKTHLGSLLMYHGIIEAIGNYVRNKDKAQQPEKELATFVTNLAGAPDARVFVFGSVFGGTGASSIPVIPKALKDAASLFESITLDLDKIKFGSTLLTQYFKFTPPDKKQLETQKVVARSESFSINSQAALQFYQSDPTVKKYYKRLYHIGWPGEEVLDLTPNGGETVTGGYDQKNVCHIVELMAACAAYDFFKVVEESKLKGAEAEFLFRSVEEKDGVCNFSGKDFIDGKHGEIFAEKLGMFLSFAHIVLTLNGAAFDSNSHGTKVFISRLSEFGTHDYNELTDPQTDEIDNYLMKFAYQVISSTNQLEPGWIYQINNSVGAGNFIFKKSAFESNPQRMRKEIDPGDLYSDEKHKWDKPKGFGSASTKSYDALCRIISDDKGCRHKDGTIKERFIAHIYNGIAKAQHFDEEK